MTYQYFNQPLMYGLNGGVPNGITSISGSSSLIDAADEKFAMVCRVPKTGTISAVSFLTGTVTTGATVDVRLETVDATTGHPTGTLVGTNTNASLTIVDTDDNKWFEVNLTAGASVTEGDVVAVVIANPSSSYGNMNFKYTYAPGYNPYPNYLIYMDLYTGSWAKNGSYDPILSLKYSDGSYPILPGSVPISGVGTDTSAGYSSGSAFTIPFDCKICGFWGYITAASTYDATIKLVGSDYKKSDSTGLIKTVTIDKDIISSSNLSFSQFFSEISLTAGTKYRIVRESTYNWSVNYGSFNDSGVFTGFGGDNFYMTRANNPTQDSDWTNYNNATDGYRMAVLGPIISAIDIPAGGGGAYSGMPASIQNLVGGLAL